MIIRSATLDDLDGLTEVENKCFPPNEAATREEFLSRLQTYPDHFWILEEDGKIVSFINGMVVNATTISDEMYEDTSYHNEEGQWQAIFGVNTLPEYRRRGYAAAVMEKVIETAKKQGRKGCILTCKEKMIHYYAKFGYKNYGISNSLHGGVVWYDMRLEF